MSNPDSSDATDPSGQRPPAVEATMAALPSPDAGRDGSSVSSLGSKSDSGSAHFYQDRGAANSIEVDHPGPQKSETYPWPPLTHSEQSDAALRPRHSEETDLAQNDGLESISHDISTPIGFDILSPTGLLETAQSERTTRNSSPSESQREGDNEDFSLGVASSLQDPRMAQDILAVGSMGSNGTQETQDFAEVEPLAGKDRAGSLGNGDEEGSLDDESQPPDPPQAHGIGGPVDVDELAFLMDGPAMEQDDNERLDEDLLDDDSQPPDPPQAHEIVGRADVDELPAPVDVPVMDEDVNEHLDEDDNEHLDEDNDHLDEDDNAQNDISFPRLLQILLLYHGNEALGDVWDRRPRTRFFNERHRNYLPYFLSLDQLDCTQWCFIWFIGVFIVYAALDSDSIGSSMARVLARTRNTVVVAISSTFVYECCAVFIRFTWKRMNRYVTEKAEELVFGLAQRLRPDVKFWGVPLWDTASTAAVACAAACAAWGFSAVFGLFNSLSSWNFSFSIVVLIMLVSFLSHGRISFRQLWGLRTSIPRMVLCLASMNKLSDMLAGDLSLEVPAFGPGQSAWAEVDDYAIQFGLQFGLWNAMYLIMFLLRLKADTWAVRKASYPMPALSIAWWLTRATVMNMMACTAFQMMHVGLCLLKEVDWVVGLGNAMVYRLPVLRLSRDLFVDHETMFSKLPQVVGALLLALSSVLLKHATWEALEWVWPTWIEYLLSSPGFTFDGYRRYQEREWNGMVLEDTSIWGERTWPRILMTALFGIQDWWPVGLFS